MSLFKTPKSVFVPFEWGGHKWFKRDDLPRFRESEQAARYLLANPDISFRKGKPVYLQWQERDERELVDEYMRGVGTPEYASLRLEKIKERSDNGS